MLPILHYLLTENILFVIITEIRGVPLSGTENLAERGTLGTCPGNADEGKIYV